MARRRMFSQAIVESGKFLTLPKSAQLLYFHLGMAADDDGFVEAMPVIRSLTLGSKFLNTLEDEGYVITINNGLLVWITNWNDNNLLQKDRYRESPYHGLLENIRKIASGEMDTECIQNGNKMIPQYSVGKESKGYYNTRACARARTREGNEAEPEQVEPPSVQVQGHAGAESETEKTGYEGFVPPTLTEVREYVRKRGNKIDADDYYRKRSDALWLNKKGVPIKDWQHDVQTWEHYQTKPVKPAVRQDEPRGSFDTDDFLEAAFAASYARIEQDLAADHTEQEG